MDILSFWFGFLTGGFVASAAIYVWAKWTGGYED